MAFRITSAQLTETVGSMARGILADKALDRLPILADALEEAGCTLDRYQSATLRNLPADPSAMPAWVPPMLLLLATATPATLAEAEAAHAEAERLARFRRSAFARCGLIGCRDSLAALARGITRRRPRGSGSKMELAKRLEGRLNELAERRWARSCKGQRKPTAAQLADLIHRIHTATDAPQVRAIARRIDSRDVAAAAVTADRHGAGFLDGGTAFSYGYRRETTTAQAQRIAGGFIRVIVARGSRSAAAVQASARHWREALATLKGV